MGTRFLFCAVLSILEILESDLLNLDMSEINDVFSKLKGDEENKVHFNFLPDFETIIKKA